MDKEYLENYEEVERKQYERFRKNIIEGNFNVNKERYPPFERFRNIQRPIALTNLETAHINNIWSQVPFCGSLILPLPHWPQVEFEKYLFNISETQKIIDFVKETGKIQFVLTDNPTTYAGFDYLDPFFIEIKPPQFQGLPVSILGNKKEVKMATESFNTIVQINFTKYLKEISYSKGFMDLQFLNNILNDLHSDYIYLKLKKYAVMEELENLMIDDPLKAMNLAIACRTFIVNPNLTLLYDISNLALQDYKDAEQFHSFSHPKEIRFPLEIGKFLLEKLTYAPQGIRACYNLIDHYDSYDLQRISTSLNDAIVTDNPDLIKSRVEDLSEILESVWNDKTIPKRIKGLKIGVTLSMAAIGGVAAGPIGAIGGFLAGLGYEVLSELIDIGKDDFSEKVAKRFTKNFQVNIYDFKKKYKIN